MKRYTVWLLLAWVAVAGFFLAYKMSPTADEGIHVASAYLALTRKDFRFDPEHPPLFKYLTAIPVLIVQPNLPRDDARLWAESADPSYDSWREAREWMVQWLYSSNNNPQTLIFLSRIPAVVCLIALNAAIFLLVRRLFSERLALWTLFFTAFNPTLLAHGSLANTDVPFALASVLLLGALWSYWEKPMIRQAALCGVLIAACVLTKFSGLVALPVAMIWFMYVAYRKKLRRNALVAATLVPGIVFALIWAIYLFHSTVPSILPSDFIKGIRLVSAGSSIGRGTFLLGTMYPTGVWFYFPVIFLVKTQLIGIIMLCAALLATNWSSIRKIGHAPLLIMLFTVVFAALSIQSKLNLGIRHISPLLPLAAIAMAAGALWIINAKPHFKWAIVGLYVLPVLLQWNNPLGFTSVLVGHPNLSYQLVESNGDWGQQTRDIAKAGYKEVRANYLWDNRALAAYGVNAQGFDVNNPPEGEIIMVGAIQLNSDQNYAAFKNYTPFAHISNHTFFYRFPESAIVPE